jgi:hypothetical protein
MDNTEQPLDLVKKAMELAGGEMHFKSEFNNTTELLTGGAHNAVEFERIKALGVEVPGRIWDLLCLLMVEAFQPVIMNSEDPKTALRQFFLDKFSQPEYGWGKTRQLIREAIASAGLTDKQLESIYPLVDALPQMMINEIVEAVIPLMIIPKTESDKLTGILLEMFKEKRNVNHS